MKDIILKSEGHSENWILYLNVFTLRNKDYYFYRYHHYMYYYFQTEYSTYYNLLGQRDLSI